MAGALNWGLVALIAGTVSVLSATAAAEGPGLPGPAQVRTAPRKETVMYPPEDNHPHKAAVGDWIEHKLMPGFPMTVQATRECETDSGRPEPHDAYQITDPDGNEDWLCAYDVQAAP